MYHTIKLTFQPSLSTSSHSTLDLEFRSLCFQLFRAEGISIFADAYYFRCELQVGVSVLDLVCCTRSFSQLLESDTLSMKDYKEQMKNIYSSCISISTLDEAPMAYKNCNEIIQSIEPTAEIIDHLKALYNFKAEE